MAEPTHIVVRGARQHNLKGVDVEVPRNALVVFTGVSGSGKSSLVFDTIYAEGQRRFVESLSSYARQFLGQLERPDVDLVEGVSPTLAIDQKTVNRNPRSTVGTVTEIADHLRLLFARLGTPRCPICDTEVARLGVDAIVDAVLDAGRGERVQVLAPVVQDRKGEYRAEMARLSREGWVRARIDGEVCDLDDPPTLDRYKKHTIEVVVDRLRASQQDRPRLAEAVEVALDLGGQVVTVLIGDQEHTFSAARACPNHPDVSVPELEPRLFSFNAAQGACPTCEGLGVLERFEPSLLLDEDAPGFACVRAFTADDHLPFSRFGAAELVEVLEGLGVEADAPPRSWSAQTRQRFLHGDANLTYRMVKRGGRGVERRVWEGLLAHLDRCWSIARLPNLARMRSASTCPDCGGARLGPISRAVTFRDRHLPELSELTVRDARSFFDGVTLSDEEREVGALIVAELRDRLRFLDDVGLSYLTLARSAATLSGGESQRIRLASQVGSGLRGVTYVLDEPSIGLHPRDNARLLDALRELRDRGNSVLVVEHDADTILAADWVVDIGPDAGLSGGHLVSSGPVSALLASDGLTARYLRGELVVPQPAERRRGEHTLGLKAARKHNLKGVDLQIPLGTFTCITGVSGSGKSTLIFGVLEPNLLRALDPQQGAAWSDCEGVDGLEHVDKVIRIHQDPIGRTPRSNPATYTGAMDVLRDLFAQTPEARARGYTKSRFSFNVAGGRCEDCGGAGVRTIEMQLLPDVQVVCESCLGRRFNRETLDVRWKGLSIADVLDLTIGEALEVFGRLPKLKRVLQTLVDVGLDYVRLGQPSTTLSGGEAQRMKLASELHRPQTGRTLYLLDEPTTGLHFHDVSKLLVAIQRLVELGNTVVVVEHNTELVLAADHLIELGPEGGDGGGQLVGSGTPEALAALPTHTGRALAAAMQGFALPIAADAEVLPLASTTTQLSVWGARTHNLQGVDVTVPHNSFTVITGPSGSGKTSLAFDTLFAEGQRRYVESLSTYARRFLGRVERAPLDRIEGLQPAIAIDQSNTSHNPRSTVATVTEIHDVLRVLYSRAGTPHCPTCDAVLEAVSPSRAATHLATAALGKGWLVAPLNSDGDAPTRRKLLRREGWTRLLDRSGAAPAEVALDDDACLALLGAAPWLVVDRFDPGRTERSRVTEAVGRAYRYGGGQGAFVPREGEAIALTAALTCPTHGTLLAELTPRHFSFNTRVGACVVCDGLGRVGSTTCPGCDGARLAPIPAAVRVLGQRLHAFSSASVQDALERVDAWRFAGEAATIAARPVLELQRRLAFLRDVGLGYLHLDRAADTLSGGEAQRIRLASQLGSGLVGVTYVLDEPTIGLHPRDTGRLLDTLVGLRDQGNTVICVEHDPDTIRRADLVIDLGPGAGSYGGQVLATGTPAQIAANPDAPTGRWLSGEASIPRPLHARPLKSWMTLHGVSTHNLRVPELRVPLRAWTVVTGVSGSGKSSLILDTLAPALDALRTGSDLPEGMAGLNVPEPFDGVVVVDQAPIGRTPRSTPATYAGVMDPLRKLFASTAVSMARGWTPGRFSFNTAGGRCEVCEGRGAVHIEMHFLPDVWMPCEACRGRRYLKDTLEARWKGHSIADVLGMRADEAIGLFENQRKLHRTLKALVDVGLGYIALGQPGHTLSGGEAQRLKLAKELVQRPGHRIYLLDEPTTGLHLSDVAKLVEVLHRLADAGHTVIVIEHHLSMLWQADHLIELGPDGGDGGGEVIAEGPPEEVADGVTATGVALAGDRPPAVERKVRGRRTKR